MRDEPGGGGEHDPTSSSARRDSVAIILASATGAISAFVIQWAVGRFSTAELTAEFLVYWALLFAAFGIVGGVKNETTRAVGSARRGVSSSTRALTAALILGGAGALLVLVTAPLWAHRLIPATTPAILPVIAVAVLAYACHVTLLGSLSGRESWLGFSATMIAESVLRLVLVGAVLLVGGGLMALEVAVAVSALTWAGLLVASREARRALGARVDVGLGRLLRNHTYTITSSVASSTLIVGFPVLMQLTSRGTEAAVLASTIFAISLTRSPIMIPLQAFQGYAIVAFLRSPGSRLRALVRPLGIIGALGVVAAVAAGLVGPWLIDVLFAGKFSVAAGTFAGLMLGAATLAMLTLSGTAALASNAHVGYTTGWAAAALAAFALLLLPLPLPDRSVIALVVGPVVGLAIHLGAIALGARTAAPGPQSAIE